MKDIESPADGVSLKGSYRPDLDGLRGIAVISVVAYHAMCVLSPQSKGWGYLGVDLFFVLSGYLIGAILYNETQTECFSLLGFWKRRARRLVPALIPLIGTAAALGSFMLTPQHSGMFFRSLGWTGLAASNLFFAEVTEYQAPQSIYHPLLHLWTLATEVQFYLFASLLALAAKRRTFLILGFAGLASLAACFALDPVSQEAFFHPQYRVWEFVAGCLLARKWSSLCTTKPGTFVDHFGGSVNLLALLALLVGSFRHLHLPVLYSRLAAVGISAALIYQARNSGYLRAALSWPALRLIGKLSYSLYLWHFALLSFYAHWIRAAAQSPTWGAVGAVVAFSVGIAFLSWQFIEEPFRMRNPLQRTKVSIVALSLGVVVLIMGLLNLSLLESFHNRLFFSAPTLGGCKEPRWNFQEGVCTIGDDQKTPTVALAGNSYAFAASEGLALLLKSRGLSGILAAMGGCNFMLDHQARSPKCRPVAAEWERVLRDPAIKNLIIWAGNNGFSQVCENKPSDDCLSLFTGEHGPLNRRDTWAAYLTSLNRAANSGKRLVLVYPHPTYGDWDIKQEFLQSIGAVSPYRFFELGSWPSLPTEPMRVLAPHWTHYQVFDAVKGPDVIRLYPTPLLCGGAPMKCTVQVPDHGWLYEDSEHFSAAGSRYVIGRLFEDVSFR